MKNILLLLLLASNIGFAQDFNNLNFNSQYSDQLLGIEEYETGFLLSGYVSDSAYSSTFDIYGASLLIKLTKSGNPIDTFVLDTFGYTDLILNSIYKDGYFYSFGISRSNNDSFKLMVSKMDTNFNLVQKKVFG